MTQRRTCEICKVTAEVHIEVQGVTFSWTCPNGHENVRAFPYEGSHK